MSEETEIQGLSKSNGGAKYAVVGVLLMLGTGAIWYLTKPQAEAERTAPTPVAAPAPAAAPTTQFDDTLDVPEEAAPAPTEATPTTTAAPRVARTDWDCSGALSESQIRAAIAPNQNQVRQCYERRLRVDPLLAGRLQVRMKVNASGAVQAVAVDGTLRDSEVVSCVRERVKQWHFPSPAGGACAVIGVPFALNPRQ